MTHRIDIGEEDRRASQGVITKEAQAVFNRHKRDSGRTGGTAARKPVAKTGSATLTSPADKHGQRPYTLESANVEAELNRQRLAALSEIDATNAAIQDISDRAAADTAAIQARSDVEIAGRQQRIDDLLRIVGMTNRALELPKAPQITERQAEPGKEPQL